jgi:tetratricopeptide (TPR) repeat protein
MTVRRALNAAAILIATLTIGQAAFAQQGDGEQTIVAPANPVGEAPAPEYNPVVKNDLGAFALCMSIYDYEVSGEASGDRAAQEAGCTNVIETGPARQRASAHYARAQIRRLDGRSVLALEDFDALVAMNPRDVFFLQNRAALHNLMGNYDLARADNMAALKIDPLNSDAHNSMCWALAMEGQDLDRALSYCNISIGLMTNNAAALDSRGMVYLKMGKYELGLADFERALRIDPHSAHFMYGRGIVLLRLGREEDGRKAIALAVEADPAIASQYDGYGVKP